MRVCLKLEKESRGVTVRMCFKLGEIWVKGGTLRHEGLLKERRKRGAGRGCENLLKTRRKMG